MSYPFYFFIDSASVNIQLLAVAFYAIIVTTVLLKVLDVAMGLRVQDEEEVIGLDITQHEESAYTLLD